MSFIRNSTFVKRDIRILEREFNVTEYYFNTTIKLQLPIAFFKQFFYLLFNINKFHSVVVQSSGYVSFLPVILGKLFNTPVVIIAIGTDCANRPEINYGAHRKPILSWFTRFSFRFASLILPVHKSLEESYYSYMKIKFPNQGIRSFIPNIKTPIIEMVNGFDTEKWKLLDMKRKPNSFLTVTLALTETGYYLKGIDLIVVLAKAFPTYNFTIVGKVYMKETCPENIILMENLSHSDLLEVYNQHQYYLQLSMSEGFPNALCEAMLCGCIPIGSDVAGIPDIIGEAGYILKKKNEEDLIELINNLSKSTITREEARDQIIANFPLSRRESEFLAHISHL